MSRSHSAVADPQLRTERSSSLPIHENVRWPTGATPTESPWPAIAVAILATAVLVTIPFLVNHRYYFIDDAISEVVPKAVDIGRMILSGQFPWITTNIMNGSGYAHEYIMGVFNPFNLMLYVMQALVPDFAVGAYLRSLVNCCIIAASVAWLARTLSLSTVLAVALAVSVSFNPYTIAWTAAAWVPGLAAFTWLTAAVAAIVSFHLRPRHATGWLVLIGTYCCLTSGYPYTVLVIGFFAVLLILVRLSLRLPLGETLWLAAWLGGGVICSMVAIVPLLAGFEVTGRNSGVENTVNFNVASLESLLQFANPSYYGFFNNWGGYLLQRLPMFYAAWFLLPVFVLFSPRPLPARIQALVITVLAAIGLSAIMAMGPEHLLVLRFPTRALQFFHFFLIVLAALLMAYGTFSFSRRRLVVLLSIEALLVVNAMQANPVLIRHLVTALPVVCLLVALWWIGRRGAAAAEDKAPSASFAAADGIILTATLASLGILAFFHPLARGVDWGYPVDSAALKPLHEGRRTLFLGGYFPPDWGAGPYQEYRYATTGLLAGDQQINGYSSIGHRFLRKHFPIDDHGNFAPGVVRKFAAIDPASGLQYLELAKVDQLVALNGPMVEDATATLGPNWTMESRGPFAAVFAHAPYALPGLVSYVSPGIDVAAVAPEVCRPLHRRECVSVRSSAGGNIVFARLWLPGYSARLNETYLPVVRSADFLVGVEIPAGVTGTLELRYSPPGLRTTGLMALATVGCLAVLSVGSSLMRRRRKPLPAG